MAEMQCKCFMALTRSSPVCVETYGLVIWARKRDANCVCNQYLSCFNCHCKRIIFKCTVSHNMVFNLFYRIFAQYMCNQE